MYVTFIISELKKWSREPLTKVMVFYPLFFGLIGRYLIPYIEEELGLFGGLFITSYADVILAVLSLFMPLIFGALLGFSFLDDRDDNSLEAVKVSPLGLEKYFFFRVLMVYICSVLACVFVILFSDIVSLELSRVLSISVLASLSAPLTGMFINSFATNKIEGFAVMKGFGILIIFPIIALFFTDFKELFFAFAPGFFPAKALSDLIRSEALFMSYNQYIIWGWVYGIVVNILIYNVFKKRVNF